MKNAESGKSEQREYVIDGLVVLGVAAMVAGAHMLAGLSGALVVGGLLAFGVGLMSSIGAQG